jgi:hypothetical protein
LTPCGLTATPGNHTWTRHRLGIGQHLPNAVEHLILDTRGNTPAPRTGARGV